MNKQMMWILVVVALLVGAYAGYYYEKTKLVNMMTAQRSDMQRQIEESKMKRANDEEPVKGDDKTMETPEPTGVMMKK